MCRLRACFQCSGSQCTILPFSVLACTEPWATGGERLTASQFLHAIALHTCEFIDSQEYVSVSKYPIDIPISFSFWSSC